MSSPPPSNRQDLTIPNPSNASKPISISSFSAAPELTTSLDPTAPLIFAHGASGSMHTPSVLSFCTGASHHRDVVTFQGNMNMRSRVGSFVAVAQWAAEQHMATTGKTRETYHTITNSSGAVLGGRSMGARAAVMAAGELETRGLIASGEADAGGEEVMVKLNKRLVLVSYPLIAGNGKGESKMEEREQLLLDLPASFEVLFIIGTRDSMCPLDKLQEAREKMTAKSWLVRVEGANHGMEVKPKGKMAEVVEETGRVAALWLEARNTERRESRIWLEDKAEGQESKGKEKEVKFSHWQAELPEHENGEGEGADDAHDAAEEAERDEHGEDEESAGEEHGNTPKKGPKHTKSTPKAKVSAQSKRELTEEAADGGKETSKKKPRKAPTTKAAELGAGASTNGSIASRTRSGRKT